LKGFGLFLDKEAIDVVVRDAAVFAAAAGKGGDPASRIDNDRLALGRRPAPQVDVVGSIALEECTDLNGFFASPILFVVVERRSSFFADRRR